VEGIYLRDYDPLSRKSDPCFFVVGTGAGLASGHDFFTFLGVTFKVVSATWTLNPSHTFESQFLPT